MAEYMVILRSLMSADNATRTAAQDQYEVLKRDRPAALVGGLVMALKQHDVDQAPREQAAVLLRQCLGQLRSEGSIWSSLVLEPSQMEVLATLLRLLEAEPSDSVRRKIAHCIQSVANQLIDVDPDQRPINAHHWPELLPSLIRITMDSCIAPGVRADAIWTVKEITRSVWPILLASSEQTVQVMRSCLSDGDKSVKAAAACLLCEVVASVDPSEERSLFVQLLPALFSVVEQLASSAGVEDARHLKLVLQDMISIAESAASFYKDCIGSHLLPGLCQLARSHSDDEVRRLALEVLCSAFENKPKMMLKIPNSLNAVLETSVHFLVELSDDIDGWAASEARESSADGEEQHDCGAEVIDRVCGAIHKADSFPKVTGVLQQGMSALLSQAGWKPIVAGLVLLRQITEYVDDEETLVKSMKVVKAQLQADHPRVRGAAWGGLQQLAQDHAEVVCADDWPAQCLPEILKGLEDPSSRNVLACMSAFQHYGENVERESLEPFVGALMQTLGQRLHGSSAIQREAITCIAVVAGQIQEGFAQYYEPLMPVLKQIIAAVIHKVEERVLLGKAFECVSLLANAVGKKTFSNDAGVILDALVKATQVPNLPSDDPVREYMMSAAERLCSTLREEFLPFVPHLLPSVLGNLKLAPKEYDQDTTPPESQDLNMTIVPCDDGQAKVLVMSSSELEDLRNAVQCVHTFVEKLGQGFAPFIMQTAEALLPVFEFCMSEEVRDLAFETWGQLCHAAHDAGQKQTVSALVLEFMKRILPKLEMPSVDVEALKTRADGVVACLNEAGPDILDAGQVRHICQLALNLVSESFARQSALRSATSGGPSRTNGAANEDSDEEDDEEEADEGDEEMLRQSACNCATAIMKNHQDLFVAEGLPLFTALVQELLQPSRPVGDRRLGLYVVSSLCEHLGEKVVDRWSIFLPQVLTYIVCDDFDLQSPACYAASFIARQPLFASHASETACRLAEVVGRARSRVKKKSNKLAQMAADNALSALLEVLLHHETTLGGVAPQMWSAWISGLPCQEDDAEGFRNHGCLLQLAQKQKAEVLGADGANVPKILAILVDVYRTAMADDVTSWGIGRLLVGLGESSLERYAASFPLKRRKKLAKIIRDASKTVST
eukprot:TRINITY_DN61025_c0_g1_i1.p1 TRINITY_DN61025_c0_g1~~TRINITY_DN61025_c0_g1_i1.p1  ORF type:complete len:1124 (+),score=179.06 TRINITY_DN61025_c0_g1_i1:84-3455(+)